MKKLNKLFAILIAVLGVQTLSAQTWTAPVIGQDLKDVNNNTELYMYNVKADAFACSGMSWSTHATVKELQNGDTKLSANVHRCRVSKPTDGQLQIMLNERQWLGGNLDKNNDCWVDFGSNNVYIYSEVSDNVYTLKPTTATNESYLDCAWAYGGHITFSATNGYGNTEWAFVLRTDITNGKYLLYKAKKEMYDIYQALVEAGHDGTYADALATANAAYTASDATAATVNAATKVLLKVVAPALSSKYFAANSLFNNPDMRGYGDDTDWGNGLNAFANGIFESWHSVETITQTQTGLPNGFYTVVFLGMYRQDGSDAAPTLTLTSGGNSAKANLKALTEIDFGSIQGAGKNANNAEDWVSNKPNNTYGAGEALAHTDAGVKVENFVVENGELTITVAMPSGSQWLLCQGFQIYFKAESLDEYANLFYAAKSAAEAFNTEELNAAAASKLTTALSAAATEQMDKEWYQARTAELNAAVALANEIKAPYANLTPLIALCTEYTSTQNSNANSDEVLTDFQTAISNATTAGDNATSADEINTAYNDLESARQTYAKNAVPVYPYAFDMTFLLTNPNFDSNTNGWTATGGAGRMSAGNMECYNGNFTFALADKLTGLGNGTWEVSVDGFYRYGGYNDAEAAHNGGTEDLKVKFYANANEVALKSIMEGANKAGGVGATTTGGVRVPNSPADGNSYFPTGCYSNTVSTLVTDGTLTFGLKKESTQGSDWTLFDNFRLMYKGVDVSELQTNLSALITKAEGIKSSKMGITESTNLIAALDAADASVTVADDLNEMLSALQSAYDAAVASIDTYSKVPAYITKANRVDASIAVSYQAQYEEGTLVGNAETIRQELNVATANYVAANFKNEIQLTEWGAESNAMWSASGEHWDGTTGEGSTSYYDANGTNTTHTLSKKVELTPGTYVFRGAGRAHPNTTLSLSVDIDGIEPAVFTAKNNSGRGIDKEGNATFADDAQYARDGQGQGWEWEFIKFTLNETTTVTLTATCQSTGWGWASFANNGLWMDDATYVVANAGALTTPKTKAEELVTKPMGAIEKTALTTAIEQANGTISTPDQLNAAIEALNSAIADAEPSIAKYEEVNAYITKANNIDESIAAEYQSQYNTGALSEDAVTIFQALEVATYNYVKENFPYEVALSNTWSSTGTNTSAKEFNNEHWSGETRGYMNQNDDNGQGWNANAWSLDFDQDVTLPAGEYVFKVAGRKSAGTTLELVVTMGETELGTVNDFPASNNARGINKAGVTSFDPEDEAGFARDGNGFGWQWRYVKFTLNAESTVKVAVHAEANSHGQWVSFGDYTLQMTEETYLEANKGGLDAPTAAAQALVNAVPMGTGEIAALNKALNLPVTTGQQLLDKIEALNTAVANANAWVTDYNEAKAPLVAALDRFEADYNDSQNGALNHMNKGRWTTAIEKAQAAAVAKDVTDSYEGFAAATEELVAALAAATTSIGEYTELKAAIEKADELGGGDDWGDEPFQKSESAKESFNTTKTQAQTAYEVAEVDGEEVTAVIESLNNAINGVVLNAPEEGQRYYIKVATEGHGKKDNAWLVTLGATGDNNPTGYGINANNAVKGHLNQAFIFTQVEGNLYNISIERAEGTVYLTYGALNGSAAGWKNQQIQATTDAEKKGEFKIVPTGKNGILKILNTIDNNYLDCQDGGSIYTDTNIEKEEFAFELATETEVTLALSEVGWATLILPFNATLPEDVKAYSCTEADGETLTLTKAESLKANTPYLMNGEEGKHVFTGYGLADKDSYTDGLFTGTYVDYQTTADGKTYVLQNQNGNLAFYLVTDAAQPWIRAYRSYMVYEGAAGAPKFSLGRGEGTTSIDKAQLTIDNVVIYDLMGRKVNTMEKGGVYIVNGKKVVIK